MSSRRKRSTCTAYTEAKAPWLCGRAIIFLV
jgi:hypothetical protein